jgi:hypothetical protein
VSLPSLSLTLITFHAVVQEAFISPCNPAIMTPWPPQRWFIGACAEARSSSATT